jgi:hypothetical protein
MPSPLRPSLHKGRYTVRCGRRTQGVSNKDLITKDVNGERGVAHWKRRIGKLAHNFNLLESSVIYLDVARLAEVCSKQLSAG